MSFSMEEILGEMAAASRLGREWLGQDEGFGYIERHGRKRMDRALVLERKRRQARRTYAAVRADPNRHERYLARRRSWWRRLNPMLTCVDCGATVDATRVDCKRCSRCLVVHRRALAAARQRAYRLRITTGGGA